MAKPTPIAPARLEVSDLHAYYGKSHVLQGCSLTVDQGCVAVLGRNGMGKTTLLRSVMGLISSRSGSIRWREKTFHDCKHGDRLCAARTAPFHFAIRRRTSDTHLPSDRRS